MKKTIKFLSIITTISLLVGILTFNVSAAASVTTGGGEYTVGQSVSIPVKITSDTPIMTAQIKISYNSSVLTLKSVSGAEYTTGNGSINIVDDNFSTATKDVTTGSYTLTFTAVAAGSSNISASVSIADKNLSKSTTSASSKVNVVTPKPSSNANLASIRLSSGSLSPAFNANTTSYDATVKFSVESVTISASVADGGASVVGAGTINLNIGDNSRVLTVTAADGSKKSYTINIKRMTEQETADAEQAARDANPLLVIIDNTDYTIVNSFEGITIPAGFTQGTATRKDAEIAVLNDEHGQYQLYWLTDAQGENGAFYTRDGNDKFTRISCINVSGKMYIIEDPDVEGYIPDGFNKSKRTVDGVEIEVYEYIESKLSDFYIVKCYIGGNRGYYRFDTVEQTMQRAADFDLAVINTNSESVESKPEGKFAWFKNMNKIGKALFIMIVFVAVMLVALAVILIVRIASSKDMDFEDEFVSMADNDFVLNDVAQEDSIDNKPQLIDDTDSLFESEENIIMQDENTEE